MLDLDIRSNRHCLARHCIPSMEFAGVIFADQWAELTFLMITHPRDLGLALLGYCWVMSDDIACQVFIFAAIPIVLARLCTPSDEALFVSKPQTWKPYHAHDDTLAP
jgi:hypothetical protein